MKKNLVAMTFASLASMLVLAPLPASAWCILGFIGDTCGAPPSGGGGGTRPVPGPLVGGRSAGRRSRLRRLLARAALSAQV